MGKEENAIQNAIMDLLSYRNVFHWRNNTTPIYDPSRKCFRKMNSMKGIPDIICIINGRFLGIEVKTLTGKQSPDQKEFEKVCLKNGGVYCLARSVEDVQEVLNDLLK